MMTMSIPEKIIQPVDREVGARIRLRRKLVGMSQDTLAKSIGVTFQQVQKYEKGTNRIGSSRIHDIASTLAVPVAALFGGPEGDAGTDYSSKDPGETVMSKDTIDLNKAFLKIRSPQVKAAVLGFVKALANRE